MKDDLEYKARTEAVRNAIRKLCLLLEANAKSLHFARSDLEKAYKSLNERRRIPTRMMPNNISTYYSLFFFNPDYARKLIRGERPLDADHMNRMRAVLIELLHWDEALVPLITDEASWKRLL